MQFCIFFFGLDVVEIQGKRGCKVPVLLIKVVKKAVILLMDKREAVGIHLRNTYLFATPSACSVSDLRPSSLNLPVQQNYWSSGSKRVGKPLDQIDVDVNDGICNKILDSIHSGSLNHLGYVCCSCSDISIG